MATTMYNAFKARLGDGTIDWDGAGTFRVLLVGTGYTPDPDHEFVSSVTSELSGGGYARQTLTGRAVVVNTTADRAEYDAADVAFGAVTTGTVRAAIVYLRVGADDSTPADDILVGYFQLPSDLVLSASTTSVQVTWPSTGVFTIT